MALAAALAAAAAAARGLRIPLTVTQPTGISDNQAHVSTGVPLLPGQAQDVRELRLLDDRGVEITAQFRPLARWWHKDNSLRWVLVDFTTRIGGFQSKRFILTGPGGKRYSSPLKAEVSDGSIVVTTGTAQFTINRKGFNLFDRVRIDRNGDGEYAVDEECVSPDADSGSVVEDTFGQQYRSSAGTRRVEVEEAGPARVCVVAKGVHRAPQGKGYSRGMYGYDVRMHFYAGSNLVRLDAVIHSGLAKPTGSPTFEDYSLKLKLNLEAEPLPSDADHPKVAWAKLYGVAPLDRALEPSESLALYQDSNGAETWKINSGVKGGDQADISSFRGYKVWLKNGARRAEVAAGDHARGLVGVGGRRFGIVIVPRYFWQQFPKAIEVGHDGRVRIGILPGEYKAPHWFHDAAGAGQEMWLLFYGRGLTGKAKPQYIRDRWTKSDKHRGLMRDRPVPHCLADQLIPRLVALCSPEHYAACGALSDMGTYLSIRGMAPFRLGMTERRYFMTDYLKGNAYGWQVFGCRWEENAGHSPYNYEPILSSDYLYRYINSQHPTWLEFGLRRNMHFRNCRAYKIDGADPFGYTTWRAQDGSGFSQNNVSEDWCKRSQPKDEEARKYSQGRTGGRVGWYLPDPAHVCVDELVDLYCLFGDTRALEGARNAGAVGGAFAALHGKAQTTRLYGWGMRTLMRYYDLTGDPKCRAYVDRAIERFWNIARESKHRAVVPVHRPGTGYEGWYMNIVGRSVIMAWDLTGDERMRDLAIGLAKGRDKQLLRYPSLCAFTYDQTGNPAFRHDKTETFATYWASQITQIHSRNYYVASDGYLWAKPRPDTTPPAAVADLAAKALGGGQVRLTWQAPGDDGREGTAAIYQVKWSDVPIVETASGEGACNFWAAENVDGEPKPAPAGSAEQMVLKGLKPGIYHFAIKARDDYNNDSPISNVVSVTVR